MKESTARIIEFPVDLKESIRMSLADLSKKVSTRDRVQDYIKSLMQLYGLREIKIHDLYLSVWRTKANGLGFDVIHPNAISVDGSCPFCRENFKDNATTFYVLPGWLHDKYIYACKCQRFFGVYWRKEE